MSTSNTLTKTDLTNILNEIVAIDGTDMTSQEIEDFVDSLNVTGINAVDYIVEQGTDSGWTYRKWNSGYAECWLGGFSLGATTFTSWSSGLYYHDFASAKAFPFTFTVAPKIMVTPKESQSWLGSTWSATTTNVGTIRMLANGSSSRTPIVDIYVFGTWK